MTISGPLAASTRVEAHVLGNHRRRLRDGRDAAGHNKDCNSFHGYLFRNETCRENSRRNGFGRINAVSLGAIRSKPLHDLDRIAIRITNKNRSHPGIGVVSRVGTPNFAKMLPGGRGIVDLKREMARAGRVGRLPRNEVNVLRAEVVPHHDEIECGRPRSLPQTEHPRVKASRQFEVGDDD